MMPHVAGTFLQCTGVSQKHWDYAHKNLRALTDFEDNGHGGAIVMPENMVILGISILQLCF